MLELIGLIACIWIAVKFLPNFLMFVLKLLVAILIIWLVISLCSTFFGTVILL